MSRLGRSMVFARPRAGQPATIVYPPFSSLVGYGSGFTVVGSASLSGGTVSLPIDNAYDAGAYSNSKYALEGSSIFTRVTASLYTSNNSREIYWGFRDTQSGSASNEVGWYFNTDLSSQNEAYPYIMQNGSSALGPGFAYTSGAALWIRVRESGGVVYWDHAPDAGGVPGTWVNAYSLADPIPNALLQGGYLNLFGGFDNSSDTTTTATLDSFNTSSLTTASVSASDTSATTDSASVLSSYVRSSSDTSSTGDSAATLRSYARAASDTSATTDVVLRLEQVLRAEVETSATTDVASRLGADPRTNADTSITTDVAARSTQDVQSIFDTSLTTDNASSQPTVSSRDTSASTDSVARRFGAGRAPTDVSASTDFATGFSIGRRSDSDASVTADTATRGAIFRLRTSVDISTSTDSAARSLAVIRSAVDMSASSDSPTRGVTQRLITTDVSLSSDSAMAARSATRSSTDTSLTADAIVVYVSSSETSLTSDSISRIFSSGLDARTPISYTIGGALIEHAITVATTQTLSFTISQSITESARFSERLPVATLTLTPTILGVYIYGGPLIGSALGIDLLDLDGNILMSAAKTSNLPAFDETWSELVFDTGTSWGLDAEGNVWYYPGGAPVDEVAQLCVDITGNIYIVKFNLVDGDTWQTGLPIFGSGQTEQFESAIANVRFPRSGFIAQPPSSLPSTPIVLPPVVPPMFVETSSSGVTQLFTGEGHVFRANGVVLWVLPDATTNTNDGGGLSQYFSAIAQADLQASITKMASYNINFVRLRLSASYYNTLTESQQSAYIAQLVSTVDALNAAGMVVAPCMWDGVDGNYADANLITMYEELEDLAVAAITALGNTNPLLIWAPINEPNSMTFAQWQVIFQWVISTWRGAGCTLPLDIHPPYWANSGTSGDGYSDSEYDTIEEADATALAPLGVGQHQCIWASHQYYSPANAAFSLSALLASVGIVPGTSVQTKHAIIFDEVGYLNVGTTGAASNDPWTIAILQGVVSAVASHQNIVGIAAFIWAWVDANSLTTLGEPATPTTASQWFNEFVEYYLEPSAPSGPPSFSTLIEPFNESVIPSAWTDIGTVTIGGGSVAVAVTSSYGKVYTNSVYNFTGSSVSVEVDPPPIGNGSRQVLVEISTVRGSSTASPKFGIAWQASSGGVIYPYYTNSAGTETQLANVAWPSGAVYFRISELDGTVTFAYYNGTTWISLGSVAWASLGFTITTMYLSLISGYYATETASTTYFADVNVAPGS
jgi:hypothetical protein